MPNNAQNSINNPKKVSSSLLAFYHKPVAQVSTELFLTIGAVLFFAIFAIRPTILTMTDLIKEIDDKQATSDALSRKVAALSSVQVEYFSLQDQFGVLDEVVPTEPETKRTLKIIEKLASENQIEITAMTLKEVPIKDTTKTIEFRQKQPVTTNVTISTKSSYVNLRKFLETLLSVRPLMTLNNLKISHTDAPYQPDGEQVEEAITGSISIQLHYYAQAATAVEAVPVGATPLNQL